jgi:hypothetical protein
MKLGTALGDSFKTYFKKPLLFSGIYIAAMLVLIIFNIILLPSGALLAFPMALASGDVMALLSIVGLLMLLYIVVSIVTGALSLGGLIKASSAVYGGHKTSIMECLKFAFNKIWDYIILGLRVFWYSLAWVLILAMIILPLLLNAFSGTASAQAPTGEMPVEFAEMMEGFEALEGMEGMEGLEALEGLGEMDFDFDSMAGYDSYNMAPGFMANPLVGIVFLVLLVLVIYRSLRALFSFYILFDDPQIGTKEALEKSLKITKGNIWRLIGYLIVFGLIVGIGSAIISGVILDPLANAFSSTLSGYATWSMILQFILAAVITPLAILFYYITYKGWSKE